MKRWLRFLLQLAGIGLFALILWWSGSDVWVNVFSGVPQFVGLSLLLWGVSNMGAASRIHLNARAMTGRSFPWRRIYHLNMTARTLGLVVPRALSTVGAKSAALRALGIPLRRSVGIVMLDNFLDLALLIPLSLPGALYLQGSLSAPGFILLMFLIILLIAALIWWGTRARRLDSLLARLARRLPWVGRRLGLDAPAGWGPLPPTRTALAALLLTVLPNGLLALTFYAINLAAGGDAQALIFLAAYPIAQLSLLAAVTPGGLGLFDIGWLGLLRLAGVPQSEALNFVVAQRVYVTVFVLLWAGFSLLLSLTLRPLAGQE